MLEAELQKGTVWFMPAEKITLSMVQIKLHVKMHSSLGRCCGHNQCHRQHHIAQVHALMVIVPVVFALMKCILLIVCPGSAKNQPTCWLWQLWQCGVQHHLLLMQCLPNLVNSCLRGSALLCSFSNLRIAILMSQLYSFKRHQPSQQSITPAAYVLQEMCV